MSNMNSFAKSLEDLGFLLFVCPRTENIAAVAEAREIVSKAFDLLNSQDKWDKRATASHGPERNALECKADDPRAERWSIFGALVKASGMPSGLIPAHSGLDIAIRAAGYCAAEYGIAGGYPNGRMSLTYFNDYWASFSDVETLLVRTRETIDKWLRARGA